MVGIKFVIFLIFVGIVGAIGPVFGRPDANEDRQNRLKDDRDLLLSPLDNFIETVFGSLGITKPNELSTLVKYQCETYSATGAVFDGVMAGFRLINDNNCSRISEIEEIEKTTLLAARQMNENIFSGIRNIESRYSSSGNGIEKSEEEASSELTEALHNLFQGIKIILTKMCPENPLIDVENSIDSLDIAEKEANTQINGAVRTIFNPITRIVTRFVAPLLGNLGLGGRVDSGMIDSERNKAYDATNKLVHNVFNRLRISLLDMMNEKDENSKESCSSVK